MNLSIVPGVALRSPPANVRKHSGLVGKRPGGPSEISRRCNRRYESAIRTSAPEGAGDRAQGWNHRGAEGFQGAGR